jgi:hypothetical protein
MLEFVANRKIGCSSTFTFPTTTPAFPLQSPSMVGATSCRARTTQPRIQLERAFKKKSFHQSFQL